MMRELPSELSAEVWHHLAGKMVAAVPAFGDAEEGFVRALLNCLQVAIHQHRPAPRCAEGSP